MSPSRGYNIIVAPSSPKDSDRLNANAEIHGINSGRVTWHKRYQGEAPS